MPKTQEKKDAAMTVIISKALLARVETEAVRRGVSRQDFLRFVLRNYLYGVTLADPVAKPKPFTRVSKLTRFQLPLERSVFEELRKLSARAGNFSKSCIANIALLEYFGICPLWEPAPKGEVTTERTALDKIIMVTITDRLVSWLDADAAVLGVRKQELFRQIVRHWVGLSSFWPTRPPELPAIKPLPATGTKNISMSVPLQPQLDSALSRYAYRCASMSRSCCAVSFVLAWYRVNPLAPKGTDWRTLLDKS